MTIRNRLNNFRFMVITVYGPAHHVLSEEFLQEIDEVCGKEPLPKVLGGDFNLIREHQDKSSGLGDANLMNKFNDFIGKNNLRELDRAGPRYTWSNKQECPIFAKLDRILVTTDWETRFPLCLAWSLTRVGSDHSPIILDTGEHGAPRPRYFHFENHWASREGFKEMITEKWMESCNRRPEEFYSLDGWHGSLCLLRQHLKGWNIQLIGQQKREKTRLLNELETIDREAETKELTVEEWAARYTIEAKLEDIYRLEEIAWRQRVGDQWTTEGDSNTEFFHKYANGRRRKNTIISLDSEQGEIRGQGDIVSHIVNFYKTLFGPNPPQTNAPNG